jgi:hypothetical protein
MNTIPSLLMVVVDNFLTAVNTAFGCNQVQIKECVIIYVARE